MPVSTDKLHHILVPQKFMRMGQDDKPIELLKYIKPKVANKDQVIIFSNNNITCNWVSMFLDNSNVKTVCLHGDISLYHRQKKYSDFKSGRCRVLCTTNAGSRGLDTISVHHVLNYEFPTSTADYIHRYKFFLSFMIISYMKYIYICLCVHCIHYITLLDAEEPEGLIISRTVE